ncbi:hypothetical protein O4J56_00055 [Nocardiopsis sp. RSe5-2]|uniref:Uncharacterized protein n=1 Tax=Nocardiopsis endophytica TaxID=3018445 RepID=A0ABT4TWE1_9ACTN|nr:hypothetical protein [Nocardiopsis endophytica]MDA2809021.1 hypothetical protein [Nocardiopsis endophytica]
MENTIRIRVSCDVFDDDLAAMVDGLREELDQLDVDDVRPLDAGPPPPGARGDWAADASGLAVIAEKSAAVLPAVVRTVRAWRLRARPRPTIRLEIGGDVLEISEGTDHQADRAMDLFVQRHSLQRHGGETARSEP